MKNSLICLALVWSSLCVAAVCDRHEQSDERLANIHQMIETAPGAQILVVGVRPLPPAARDEAQRLLQMPGGDERTRQLLAFLSAQDPIVQNLEGLSDYLYFDMLEQSLSFLATEQDSEEFQPLPKDAPQPDAAETGPPAQVRLLVLGPVENLKLRFSYLFKGVEQFSIDTASLTQAPTTPASIPPAQEKLDAKTIEFRRKFRANPLTLKAFDNLVSTFKLEDYRGMSAAAIKDRVQRLVYEPAQPLIREWVDAKLAALRAPPSEVNPVGKIFGRKGTGVLVVDESRVAEVSQALSDICKKRMH